MIKNLKTKNLIIKVQTKLIQESITVTTKKVETKAENQKSTNHKECQPNKSLKYWESTQKQQV